MKRLVTTLVALMLAVPTLTGVAAADDPWSSGMNWLSLRAGYAKASGTGTGNGGAGYGFGYSKMLTGVRVWKFTLFRHFSLGGYVHHEILGGFPPAVQIDVPATAELVRHGSWGKTLHPYVGVGGGQFYRKTYRTGDDLRTVHFGQYLTVGANVPVSTHHVIGADARFIRLNGENDPPNPVFGPGKDPAYHMSFKVNYSLAFGK